MNRGVFSLFNWTLRRDVILMRTHLMRAVFSGIMLFVLFIAWIQTTNIDAAGLNLFTTICWMNFIVTTLAGISYFATCVTEESEAGNLGLLKLAGLGAFSILLGKSTSRLIGALMLLVVQFPFTLLAITLGGVTLVQIVSAYAAIGVHLILVANLALFFSVFCSSSGRAAAWTGLVVVLFYASGQITLFVVTSMLQAGLGVSAQAESLTEAWRLTQLDYSVVRRFSDSLEPAFTGPILTKMFWVYLGLSVLLFAVSCLGFDWFTNRQSQGGRGMLARSRRSVGRFLGVPRAWSNAFAWKEFNFMTGGRTMFWIRVVGFALLTCFVYGFRSPGSKPDWESISSTLAVCSVGAIALEVITFACRILFDESRWGTFPLLLILPMSARTIVVQKTKGCLLALLPATLCLGFAIYLYPGDRLAVVRSGQVVYFLVNFLLLVHFTVLLSLFMRWAALPAAVCLVFAFNSCCPVMSIGLVVNDLLVDSGGFLVVFVTLLTYWVLLLLPLQVEIVSRVEDAGNHEYGG